MIKWRKKHTILLGLIIVFSGLIAYFSYLILLQPKTLEIQSLQNQIETENTFIQTLQKSNKGSSEGTLLSAVELQKILPVSPFEEQFLLDLEKAETISNSLITTLAFQDGETVSVEEEDNELIETDEEELDADDEEDGGDVNTEAAKEEVMPEGLEKLTVDLTVTSPSYYELEEFLRQLENSKRLTQIESVQVEGKPEVIHLLEENNEDGQFVYNVVVSTFYLPNLEALREQLPPFFTPEPSDKENPFTNEK